MPLALFDLDNTLADRERAFLALGRQLLEQHRRPLHHLAWLVQADGDGLVPRPQFLGAARDHLDLAVTVEELVDWYAAAYPDCYVPEPDSAQAVQALKDAGWRVALVTNGQTETQRRKVKKTGLDAVVDVVCVSQEVGTRKPGAGIFREAAKRCGSSLDGWMVGDSATADIAGGAAVGLRTAWLTRGRAWSMADGPAPDYEAVNVSEVVEHLLATAGR